MISKSVYKIAVCHLADTDVPLPQSFEGAGRTESIASQINSGSIIQLLRRDLTIGVGAGMDQVWFKIDGRTGIAR